MVNTMVSCRFSLKPIHSHRFNRDEDGDDPNQHQNLKAFRESMGIFGPFPQQKGMEEASWEPPKSHVKHRFFMYLHFKNPSYESVSSPFFPITNQSFPHPSSIHHRRLNPPKWANWFWTGAAWATLGSNAFALPWRVTCVPTPAWRPGEWRNPGWRMVKVV